MTQVILLEKIEKLGEMGDTVNVKPGFARNFLLPQNKALRATDSNLAYFEAQKSTLQKANAEKKKTAEKHAATLDGMTVTIIRQAGESGQLYGSVTARDVADAINETAEQKIQRNTVELNQGIKEIGLFNVVVTLHPEVKKEVKINIARTEDEAIKQLKTGKALIDSDTLPANDDAANEAAKSSKEALMDDTALEAEKAADEAKAAADAKKAAADEAKAAAVKASETPEEEAVEEESKEA